MRLIDADALIKNLSYLYTKNHIPIDMRAKEILTTIITPADEKTHGFNRVDDRPQIF